MQIIIVIVIILIFYNYIKKHNKQNRSNIIGQKGENKVRRHIGSSVKNKKYVLNNITIFKNNISTQIDHIIINQKGVFVIETKNHSGQIYGSEDDYNWTQVLNYGKNKYELYNPIKQNETHINFLNEIINDRSIIYSIIVFQKAKLYVKSTTTVGNISIIQKTINESHTVLSVEEINDIYNKILKLKDDNKELANKHVENLERKKVLINQNICPYCNVDLIRRKGRYGDFYSCPNFPKCSYSKR